MRNHPMNTKFEKLSEYIIRESTFFSKEFDMNHNVKHLCQVKTLIVMASRKDDKRDEGTNITNPQQQTTEAASASINRAIEETRDSIKRTTEETRREIPRYRDSMTDLQRETV